MSDARREREVKNDYRVTIHDSATIKESHVLGDSTVGEHVTFTSSCVMDSTVRSGLFGDARMVHAIVSMSTVDSSRLNGCVVLRSALRNVVAVESVFTGVTITGCGTRLIGAEITDPGHYVRLVDTPWTPVVIYRCPGDKGQITVGCQTFPVTPRITPEELECVLSEEEQKIPPGLLAMWDGLVDAAVALENLWLRETENE